MDVSASGTNRKYLAVHRRILIFRPIEDKRLSCPTTSAYLVVFAGGLNAVGVQEGATLSTVAGHLVDDDHFEARQRHRRARAHRLLTALLARRRRAVRDSG